MAWFIEGDHRNLEIGIDNNGFGNISGLAKSHKLLEAENSEANFERNIGTGQFTWQVFCWNEYFSELWETQLSSVVREYPNESHCSLMFEGENDVIDGQYQGSIWAKIVLPKEHFQAVYSLLEKVLLNNDLEYHFTIGFTGFGIQKGNPKLPTFDEFILSGQFGLGGLVYMSRDIDFQVNRKKIDA